jgi:hypothetical protein
MRESFADVLVGALANMTGRLLDVVPRLCALGLLMGLGGAGAWAVAGLAQAALRAARFDRAAVRWGLWRLLQTGGVRRYPSETAGGVLGVGIFALIALLALDAVEMPGAGPLAAATLAFLPRAIGGILVGVLGIFVGRACEFGVRLAWARGGRRSTELAAAVARWAVRAGAVGCALAALGIPPLFLLLAAAVPLAAAALGAALGLAQAVHAPARRAASRWLDSFAPPGEGIPVRAPAPAGRPVPEAADVPDPIAAGVEAFARFTPSRD